MDWPTTPTTTTGRWVRAAGELLQGAGEPGVQCHVPDRGRHPGRQRGQGEGQEERAARGRPRRGMPLRAGGRRRRRPEQDDDTAGLHGVDWRPRWQERRRIAAAAAAAAGAAGAGRRQADEAAEHHDQPQADVHGQAGLPQREQKPLRSPLETVNTAWHDTRFCMYRVS